MDNKDASKTPLSTQMVKIAIPRQAILNTDLSPVVTPFHTLLRETRDKQAFSRLLRLELEGYPARSQPLTRLAEVQNWFYRLHGQHPALPFWLDAPSIQLYLEAATPKARSSERAQMLYEIGPHLLDQGLTVVVMEVLSAGQLLCYEMFPKHVAILEELVATAKHRIDAAVEALMAFGQIGPRTR